MNKVIRKLYKIDAAGRAAGRVATEIAIILKGKNKPEYQPYLDLGDIVEVINAGKLKFTGKKLEQKKYFKYSGYPGGLKETQMSKLYKIEPAEILRRAVRDMLPPVKFRKEMMKRLIIR